MRYKTVIESKNVHCTLLEKNAWLIITVETKAYNAYISYICARNFGFVCLQNVGTNHCTAYLSKSYLTFITNMPLRTPECSFNTCSGLKALTSITLLKKCGVKTCSGRQDSYILKCLFGSPYQQQRSVNVS